MRDCNMGLGDKSRRVGSVGAGHGFELEHGAGLVKDANGCCRV
jgi:hypothetical protein